MKQDFAKTCRKNLVALFERYAAATGRSPEGVAREFYGNAEFYHHFRNGGGRTEDRRRKGHSISIDRYDEMLQAISDAWPDGTAFPVMRPVHVRHGKKISRKTRFPTSNGSANQIATPAHGNRSKRSDPARSATRSSDVEVAGADGAG